MHVNERSLYERMFYVLNELFNTGINHFPIVAKSAKANLQIGRANENAGVDPDCHYRGRKNLSAATVHYSLPSGDLAHTSKFLVYYINYGYQNTGFVKLS